ncbi:DUF58 domain-containing protein [Vibrio fortis]|uniref:DUF58 domain-containing protein n=1 Tax=Vibrio fortis TaxID=212667 RepID=UPI003EBB2A19
MAQSFDSRVAASFESLMALRPQSTGFSLPPLSKSRSRQAGSHVSSYRGRGLNFEEFRHYQMGDDIRSIDWNVTQRMGEAYIRVQSEEKDLPIVLVVDQRSSMFFSSVDTMKSVVAAQVASCCGWKISKDGDRVAALIFSDHQFQWYKPQRQASHVARILQSLAQTNQLLLDSHTSQPGVGLSSALNKLAKLKLKGCLMLFISDFNGVTETDVQRIQWLKRHNDVMAVAINDPMETELTISEPLTISDGSLQLPVDRSLNSQLVNYNQEVKRAYREVYDLLRTGSLDVIRLNTSGNHIASFISQVNGGRSV